MGLKSEHFLSQHAPFPFPRQLSVKGKGEHGGMGGGWRGGGEETYEFRWEFITGVGDGSFNLPKGTSEYGDMWVQFVFPLNDHNHQIDYFRRLWCVLGVFVLP